MFSNYYTELGIEGYAKLPSMFLKPSIETLAYMANTTAAYDSYFRLLSVMVERDDDESIDMALIVYHLYAVDNHNYSAEFSRLCVYLASGGQIDADRKLAYGTELDGEIFTKAYAKCCTWDRDTLSVLQGGHRSWRQLAPVNAYLQRLRGDLDGYDDERCSTYYAWKKAATDSTLSGLMGVLEGLEVALVGDDLTAQQQAVLRKHVNQVLYSTYTSPCLHVGGKWRDDSSSSQPIRRALKALNSDCYPWWQLTQAQKLAFPGVLTQFCGVGNSAWDADEELMTAAIAAAADVVESM